MKREPVRWGIAGFGWVARDFMAPGIRAAGERLVAVCDPDPDARRAAEALGLRAYPGIEVLSVDAQVEAIYVATPNHLHRPMVEAAARGAKAVLCEKPMAATLRDAEAMAATVRGSGVLYGTAFDQRHHPAHAALRVAIRDGTLGTVTAIRIAYCCWLGSDWTKGTGDNWRADARQAGGGAVMDLAPHGLDLAEFLTGEPVADLACLLQRRVQAYEVDDGGVLVGRTASGVLLDLHVSYNCPEALPRRRLEVLGTKGQLTATDTMGQDPGGTLVFTDGATGETSPLAVPDAEASPFARQVRAFSDALRGTGEVDVFSLDRDFGTMRLLAAAYMHEEERFGRAAG
ncbi:Gfo/Idh/MocA family protein [Aureimonas leprariae]|uniref:Gfo/Idh/MocA family oxidoreductase n=1 Tax=Plantimonas leprariae TaxID=2615207 RepID=A0A7V7PRJ4_9HYPH|nr:Gfo/Idh/MocA family oxidoreductase [Aureimonas leprariae]KAB0681424.1 Gfo/Idh/MocA family oxidoreductase [Aureimonas leprariae]